MEISAWDSFSHHMLCNEQGVCTGCKKVLRSASVLCAFCKLFRYCSPKCLEEDAAQHAPVCEAVFCIQNSGVTAPLDYVFKKTLKLLSEIKLLDSNGDLKSPAALYEAYFVRYPILFERKTSKLLEVSGNDPRTSKNSVADGNNVNNYPSACQCRFNTKEPKNRSELLKQSVSFTSGNSLRNGTFGSYLQQRKISSKMDENIQNSHQNRLVVDNITDKKQSVKESCETLSGSPKLFDESNAKINEMERGAKSKNKLSASNKPEQSESETFGSGWLRGSFLSQPNTSTASAKKPKRLESLSQSDGKERQSRQANAGSTTASNSVFSKSASNKNNFSCNNTLTNNSDITRTTTDSSKNARTTTDSSINARTTMSSALSRNTDINNSASNKNEEDLYISSSNIPVKTCNEQSGASNISESDNFGSGWWKPRSAKSKKKAKSSKSNTHQTSFNVQEIMQQNRPRISSDNRCRDVILYKINVTSQHKSRFDKVASFIASTLIWPEAIHGRMLVMDLFHVPGLWKAKLGGSRISLVAEITSQFQSPNHMLGITICDKHGHTAPVLLDITLTALETNWNLRWSACLKPGTFIILLAVNWDELPNGQLAIIMRNMEHVKFIF